MTEYIRFVINNIEPLRIADDSTSQSGQTSTLKYIPGSTIRGYVINKLCNRDDFESVKKVLFSDKVRFMNCYVQKDGRELMPPIKGFYEDKTTVEGAKSIENVVIEGEFSEGNKRASLGSACAIAEDTISYYHVETGSDMKIKIRLKDKEKQNVFRSEYIVPGNLFIGYIAVDDEAYEVLEMISDVIGGTMILGNARSSGMGKCTVTDKDIVSADNYIYAGEVPQDGVSKDLYMVLLSNTVMRDEYGKYCGLNLKTLEQKLGVTDLKISFCSTSVVSVRGYNRKLGRKLSSVTMYEQGSVFHLSFEGTASQKNIQKLVSSGIGVRRNEGFGQIRFLFDYEKVDKKCEGQKNAGTVAAGLTIADDADTAKIIAKNYYRRLIRKHLEDDILSIKQGISNSQVGSVQALLLQNRYDFNAACTTLKKYFDHALEKQQKQNVQKERADISPFEKFITGSLNKTIKDVLKDDVTEIMGFPTGELMTEEEFGQMKIQYILDKFKYENRKGV